MVMEPWMIEILRKLELEYKDKFEKAYGVDIGTDALSLACNITKYSDVLLSDEGGNGDNHEVVLEKKAVEIVEKACEKLRHDIDTNVEEKALDFDEYSLRRALVESDENIREKDSAKNIWHPYEKMDHDDLMSKWTLFIEKWTPKGKIAQDIGMLEQAQQMLVQEAANVMDSILLSGADQYLGTVVTELMLTIHQSFKQNLTVTPPLIAEAASLLTGIPASWLLHCSMPALQGLEQRLAKGLFGLEHIPSLICNALSRPRPGVSRPIGSFLFLDNFGVGWPEIANALAEQLFDDKKRLIAFDLSEYSDSGSVSRLIGCPSSSSNLTGGLLTNTVKSRPFTVVLFHNVDRAHPSVTDVLIEIISHGRLSNGQGSTTDFTKTLIIMTSNAVDGKIPRIVRQNPPLKDVSPDPSYLEEVRKHFRHDLFEKLDDLILFKRFSLDQHMAAIRLQLREIASSMTEKRLIVYASNAALRCMLGSIGFHPVEYARRIWLEENVVPTLSVMLVENDIDDMCTIYIDALVGLQKLSYRLVKGAYQEEYSVSKQFMECLRTVRAEYLKEKERVNMIYLLRRNFFKLMNLQDAEARADLDSVAVIARELVKILDDLKNNAIEDSFTPNACKKGYLKSLKEELQLKPIERHHTRPKSGVQGLRMKLSNVVGQQHQAIDVVVETLLDSIDKPHGPAKSFLFLGLTGAGEADLVGCLAKLLVADDGMNLLIRIDLSKYTESDSFLQFLNGPLEHPSDHEQCGFSLLEAVRMRPYSILFFSHVEKAPMSVFSALLWILDSHKFEFDGGHTVDFRNTIVIFATDLGSKAILSRLVGHPDRGIVGDGATEQKEEKRSFRFELINRVDEMVFFNPLAREKLKEVGRLSMRAGHYLQDRCPFTFSMAFMQLFNMANDRVCNNALVPMLVYVFSKWLNNECSDLLKESMVVIRRSREEQNNW